MADVKTIGILTSGGDCAGLNAILRAVTYRAITTYGWKVIGIREGTMGLLRQPYDIEELTFEDFPGHVMRMGGTILGTTNKGDPFAFPMPDGSLRDRSDEIIKGCRDLGLDALIAIGGDGSMKIMRELARRGGLNLIGIPKTIDNDIGATEYSVGFTTAVSVAVEGLDRLQPTAASHHRVMILEVMGRDAGHIALHTAIAGGADVCLIPEIPYSIANVGQKIRSVREEGRNYGLVVVAEAVKTEDGQPVMISHTGGGSTYGGIGHYLGELITAETRVTVLGHTQRGGSPSWRDRLIASAFGVAAVDLVAQKRFDRLVTWQHRRVIDVPLSEAIASYASVDLNGTLVHTARGLGICLGDE